MLDIEKHFHELRKSDGVVKKHIAKSFQNYVKSFVDDKVQNADAAYQLIVCYVQSFEVAFQLDECLKWLNIASMDDFDSTQVALSRFAHVFHDELKDYVILIATDAMEDLSLNSVRNSSHEVSNIVDASPSEHAEYREGKFHHNDKVIEGTILLFKAVERDQYEIMKMTLSNEISGGFDIEKNVTILHFFSF